MRVSASRHDLETRLGELVAGRYLLKEVLGAGGMGAVFRAYDRELDEYVALKLLHAHRAHAAEALELFKAEVKLARRVTHRNVARTFELGDHRGLRFLTMELVERESLRRVLTRRGSESTKPSRSRAASLRAWRPRTPRASYTATSSRTTS
jgi:serine/threonine protein kinase